MAKYDLEKRTFEFAQRVRAFVECVKKSLTNVEDCRQLVRASGSVGANYIEANESISDKDFVFRIKICRKEAKESRYWLKLLNSYGDETIESEREALDREAHELTKIFGAILSKCKCN